MRYYLDENGERHNALPKMWNGITPFNELRAQELGWTTAEDEEEEAPAIDPDIAQVERQIVGVIFNLVTTYHAEQDFIAMSDITIPNLIGLATRYNVAAADLQAAETTILILARHLEALTGATWAETWDGLKNRFAGYVAELIPPTQQTE